MIRLLRYILLSGIVLLGALKAAGQTTLPDNVCIGQNRHYNVLPHTGSTYTWWIDGVIQIGFVTNEFDHTWDTGGTYQLAVQELSADGCLGTVQSGQVIVTPLITPLFERQGPYCIGSAAPSLPATSTNGITGTWSPSRISTAATGTTAYTFTPAEGQCASPATINIEVTALINPTFAVIGPLCQNSVAPALPGTSSNGITGTWSPATISTAAAGTSTYTFTPAVGQCAAPATINVEVTALIAPTITAVGPLCQNSVATALPTTSTNGITGTWSPATINTSAAGTTTYTFTPAEGQCAATATIEVVITNSITPTFAPIGQLCQNSVAPVLPATSTNGITGTWSPATISTSAVGTSTHTFTSAEGQCAAPASINVEVTASVTPTLAAVGPLCQNSVAPSLPTTSTNGITGTWTPATISTANAGTTTYNFTPVAGQCAATATLEVVVTNSITPTFASVGQLCQNSVAPVLPVTSTNGITGTWSPATISTTTVGTSTYTFTPAKGLCASTTTLEVVVTNSITPTFAAIGQLCQNSVAPALPATSTNGITGTWTPATISTTTVGTSAYTFTPAEGQCAAPATINVEVTAPAAPTFAAIGQLCQNSVAPALATTSTNGITGTWNPATISTATVGTSTYTFTFSEGQCASTATINVEVTAGVTPTFAAVGQLCQNSVAPALPTTSTNGINGTWTPASISTATVGTSTYTFTPAAGQCAAPATIEVVITNSNTPTFAAVGQLCQNSVAPALPATSTNGITGTWTPATLSTTTVGTSTYTFTPAEGQCAAPATINVEVTASITPTFAAIGQLCQNSFAPALPVTSTNGITGTWSPATISTSTVGTSTYTFTPAEGQCAATATLEVVVTNSITPTFASVGQLCQNSVAPVLPVTSTNGITGTWSPATISTTTVGTSTYTFTPTLGQCAAPASINVEVTVSVTPTFAEIGTICQNSIAPVLPATSTNGITGTWSPATISTSTVGTSTYTFTPAEGQCAATATLEVFVTNSITPTFASVGQLCRNSVAPALPATSTNGITGTWTPATLSTTTVGTSTYTFTPNSGQCASTTTIEIVTTNSITPTFNNIGPFCRNSVAPALPATSANGITGTWSPATISTIAVGATAYTFMPAAGQCALPVTMEIIITNTITPSFHQIGPFLVNSAPPSLPVSSDNIPAITGTWNPSRIETGTPGTRTYVFTPAAGQCAENTTMQVTVLAPSVSLVKTQVSGPNPVTAAGQTITYQISLTNTGNTDITGINATEAWPGSGAATLGQPVESQSSNRILNPGETWRYQASYTVTQADIDAGRNLVNTISVVTAEITGPVTATATTSAAGTPSLAVSKSATEAGYSAVGNIIHYSITVRNTGGVTLTNISVTDPLTGLNQLIAALAPGDTRTFNTTHAVNQNDLNAGTIVNTVVAAFTYSGRQYRESDTHTVRANQEPALEITKNALTSAYSAVGEVIRYTIIIRNSGNVTLSGIRVSDPQTGLNQVIATLQPGQSQSFNTTHTISLDDLNSGRFENTATAEYTFAGTLHRLMDEAIVNALQNPLLSIVKSASETSYTAAGDVIHYTITVTNTGNVTLTNVLPSDPNAILVCSGAPYTLAPGASRSCNATHVITAADVVAGRFSNTATVSGTGPGGGRINGTSNTVTVSLNNIAPSVACPASLTVPTRITTCDALISSGLAATWSDPNNNIVSLTWAMTGATISSSPATGMNNLGEYTFNRGVTTVTYTVTDRPGLSSSCSFTVTVIDNVPPVIVCTGSQNRNTDADGPGYTARGNEFDPVSVTDNCSVAGVTNNINNASSLAGVSFPVGVTRVTWTAADGSGNRASCSFTITVTDNVEPVVRCKDVTIYLDLNTGKVNLQPGDIDNGSFDNTGIASMTVSTSGFDCTDIGPNNVTLTATDRYGNTGSCLSVVTVLFAVTPAASVSTGEQVICDEGTTDIHLINNIPNTSWTWTSNASQWITGSSPNNTGRETMIRQTLLNRDTLAHTVIYSAMPRVYGLCDLPTLPVTVWINPEPEIRLNPGDTILCNDEFTNISARNPNTSVRGEWAFDLKVVPDKEISGSSQDRIMNSGTVINDMLHNNDSVLHKVVYRFTPRIISGNGPDCPGDERVVTIWVRPGIRYTKNLSNFNGYNISCYGKSDGFIWINTSRNSGPVSFNWTGPEGFESSGESVRRLEAGRYTFLITDINNCSVQDTVLLRAPDRLDIKMDLSVSMDGAFNINCADEATGSINVLPLNNVGAVKYLWNDGNTAAYRSGLKAGEYRVILTDANNCRTDSMVRLTQPEKMEEEFQVSLPYCAEKPDGEVRVSVSGGIEGNEYKYLWSDNSTSSILSGIKAGVYEVTIGDMNGCSLKSAVLVNALHELCLIIPEAFSPNNDLVNDVWNIGNADLYPRIEILIFNRWGQLLWKSEEGYPKPWDGRSNGRGRVLPVDSYHYVIDLHNGMKPIMGDITIVK